MKRSIVIRISPEHAEIFRQLWYQMGVLDIRPAENLKEAIENELLNLWLRWQDNIAEAEDALRREAREEAE